MFHSCTTTDLVAVALWLTFLAIPAEPAEGNDLPPNIARVVATIKKLGGKVELNPDSTDVVGVDLSGSRATDAALLQLKPLAALKALDLSNTRISNSGLLQLASLPNLETVNVFACSVTEAGIVALQKKAPKLIVTQVASPAVQQAAMELIRQVGGRITMTDGKVTKIDLRNDETNPCRATDDTLLVLPAFPDLETLSLEYLNISNAGLVPLRHLKNLRGLNLSEFEDHAITDEGIEHIKGLTNLEWLDLERAVITDAGLRQLAGLTRLREFWLFGRVTDAGMATLEKFPSLESLWLYCPNVTDAGLRHIKGHKLKLLEVGSWDGRPLQFTAKALSWLADMKSLEELNFRDAPQVNDMALGQLRYLVNLKTLQCERSGITLQGVDSLKRYLPKLETVKL
jgi:Leucine-rich repeat (LRR) protein